MGNQKIAPPQQEQEEQRFPLPDLSASPQIKSGKRKSAKEKKKGVDWLAPGKVIAGRRDKHNRKGE